MPSARRVRFLVMVGMAVIVTTLFFTSQFGSDESRAFQDFYGKTVNAMERKRGSGGAQIIMDGKGATAVVSEAKDKDGDGAVGEDDVQQAKEMAERLREAEQRAKDQANAKAPLKPDSPSELVGVGSSAGGQHRKLGDKDASAANPKDESDPASKVEATLNEILKKSPGMFAHFFLLLCLRPLLVDPSDPDALQLSFSPSPIAPSRSGPRECCSKNTPSTLPPMSWS